MTLTTWILAALGLGGGGWAIFHSTKIAALHAKVDALIVKADALLATVKAKV